MKVNFDVNKVATPYYIVDESLLQKNLERLQDIAMRTGCHESFYGYTRIQYIQILPCLQF